MARPPASKSEKEAVRALGDTLEGSARSKALQMAKAVVQAHLADELRADPMERALFDARLWLEPDPAHAIATAHDSTVAGKFSKERLHRFEARGCQQIGQGDWQAETRAIAKIVQKQLARRYRDYLR